MGCNRGDRGAVLRNRKGLKHTVVPIGAAGVVGVSCVDISIMIYLDHASMVAIAVI